MQGFDKLLAEAQEQLCYYGTGLAPCLQESRQNKIRYAFRLAELAAATPRQKQRAQLAVSSACLTFAREGRDPKQRVASLEQALQSLAITEDQGACTVQIRVVEFLLSAREVMLDLDLDLDAVLSFWARASKATGPSLHVHGQLNAFQAEWLLEHGNKSLAADANYKIGLKSGHEALRPAAEALQCARKLRDTKQIELLEQLQRDIHSFIEYTCLSTQVGSCIFYVLVAE